MPELRDKILALLEPVKTRKFTAPNRFVRSATFLAEADEDGEAGKAGSGRIAELACGGVGTIISGFAYISREGQSVSKQWGVDSDNRINDIKLLSESAHRHGSKFIVQLVHAGGQRSAKDLDTPLTPSGLPHPGSAAPTKALDKEGIAKICRDFAASALRAKKGGADGVQIHGGHGFLITQFLSPITNKRTDRYGGALANRARILLEIFREIKAAVGDEYPVWCKLSISDGAAGGYPASEGIAVARMLLDEEIDGIEVSNGTPYAPPANGPSVIGVSAGESEAPFKAYASELKNFSSKEQLITLTGGLRSLPVIAGLIYDGVCDLAGLSRPLLAEPDLINRWYEEDDRPSACISCNACHSTPRHGLVHCPVLRDRNEGNWSPL